MSEIKNEINNKINHIKKEGGSIAYVFENGAKLVQNINKRIFIDEKGKNRTTDDIVNIFKSIGHDLGAVSIEF